MVVNNSAGSATSNSATLTVNSAPPPSGSGRLELSTERLVFYAEGHSAPAPKTIKVMNSSGSPMTFNADVYGGSWISINPSAGTTPGQITVSAYATGLTAGTYSCVIKVTANRTTKRVYVVLVVARGGDDGGDGAKAMMMTHRRCFLSASTPEQRAWQTQRGWTAMGFRIRPRRIQRARAWS